ASAPEFTGLGNWFNSQPLTLASLRGKVVLVNFWTYGCVNCVNTLPHVTQLYSKYKDKGFVVVGIHTPEFPFEHSSNNVQAALKRHGITY
ncbi:redoxin family protein, partial [Acinetobacter baumannii]